MPPFAECCVLIPCSTIEDFPARLDRDAAQSLLGTLTAAWHPRLIAASGRIPSWYRADDLPSPPRSQPASDSTAEPVRPESSDSTENLPVRLMLVPEASVSQLPSSIRDGFPDADANRRSVTIAAETHREIRIRGQSRNDALARIDSHAAELGLACSDQSLIGDSPLQTECGRPIATQDFFALAYTYWQVQILTRRLRYTSNLDQVHFENRLIEAAEAFTDGDAQAAAEALHDCYDALAEERDHYFATDPSLIDLTLLTPSTLQPYLDLPAPSTAPDDSILATPQNALVDQDVAAAVLEATDAVRSAFADRLGHAQIGWAGGGPSASVCYEEQTIDQTERTLAESIDQVQRATGQPMIVHARLGGATPLEIIGALASRRVGKDQEHFCRGVIPIDFLGGTGFGDEAKVILGETGHEIEALTAKPVDSDNESDFLTLGTRLGEAIDAGEIATGLLVHWPGGGCDSFHDVRRAATWTLALGRFWKLDDYFVDGEHPYHHGSSSSGSTSAASRLENGANAAIESARQMRAAIQTQSQSDLAGMSMLASPSKSPSKSPAKSTLIDNAQAFAKSLGLDVETSSTVQPSTLVINGDASAARQTVTLRGKLPRDRSAVFQSTMIHGNTEAIIDVPAWGYGFISTKTSASNFNSTSTATSAQPDSDPRMIRWIKQLGRSMSRGPKLIVQDERLANEFMELVIDPNHGGIQGVYSGRVRGNRMSSRIVLDARKKGTPPVVAHLDSDEVIENSILRGIVGMKGTLGDIAWESQVELARGSRLVRYRIRFQASGDDSHELSWSRHPTLRLAFPGASPIVRAIVREKLHRTSARRILAPLGYLHEEDERKTLVASHGNALHGRVEDRFMETLLPIANSSDADSDGFTPWHEFAFGFDVPHPIHAATSAWRAPVVVPLAEASTLPNGVPDRSWLMHASPSTLTLQVVNAAVLADGRLAMHLRAIQTTSQATRAAVRFCHNVELAHHVSALSRPLAPSPESNNQPSIQDIDVVSIDGEVKCEGDKVGWTTPGHGVTHLCVVLATGPTN